MDELTTRLECQRCGTGFRIELDKVRSGLPNSCPSCGAQCEVPGDRATNAHRLLEILERRNRTAASVAAKPEDRRGPLPPLPFRDLPLFDDLRPGPHEEVLGEADTSAAVADP
jgi:hypothetical protein